MKPADILRSLLLLGGCATFSSLDSGSAQIWTRTSAPGINWRSVACSADGKKMVAVVQNGGIYTSADSGTTWNLTGAPSQYWTSVASSADGSMLVAAAGSSIYGLNGSIYTSTTGGGSWVSNNVSVKDLRGVAISADGQVLQAVAYDVYPAKGLIWSSINRGLTWARDDVLYSAYLSVASSADGNKQVVAGISGTVFISTNTGSDWRTNSSPASYINAVVCSADGTKLVILDGLHENIFTSTNSGSAWRSNYVGYTQDWGSLAGSADGKKLAVVAGGCILTSTNSGASWNSNNVPANLWKGVATSADGNMIVAVATPQSGYGGGIYVSQTTPKPQLTLNVSSHLVLSWMVPSTNFVLQQSSDLTASNWVTLSNTPVLNPTNLQYEVFLPLAGGNRFYRLATP